MKSADKPDIFTLFATNTSAILGRPWVFAGAIGVLILWGFSGPLLGFSDTWQLIINTSTTIITFLMVFIIQNTQNRDNLAMNIKLDALMKKSGITRDDLLQAENESDTKLEKDVKRVSSTKPATRKRSHRSSAAKKHR